MASAVESEILRDMWYMALPGQQLKRGQILGKKLLGNLKVYAGDKHPHEAQTPVALDIGKLNRKNVGV